jgi:galactose mutarotase-like enzyme
MPAGLYRRHFSPRNYLSGETEDIQFAGGKMPFERDKLPGSYILELVDAPERTFTFTDQPSGRSVVLDLPGVPYLTLWSDGGPFLCVEPCWGLTDHHEQRAFEDKEGIQKIPAGQELVAGFSFAPRLA